MSTTLARIETARTECTTLQYLQAPNTNKKVVLGTVDLGCVHKKLGISK